MRVGSIAHPIFKGEMVPMCKSENNDRGKKSKYSLGKTPGQIPVKGVLIYLPFLFLRRISWAFRFKAEDISLAWR